MGVTDSGQLLLFDRGVPGARTRDRRTARQAWRSVRGELTEREQAVYDAIAHYGSRGATIDEIAYYLRAEKSSVSPRTRPMERKKVIKDSGQRRVGDSGRAQTVWVVTNYEPANAGPLAGDGLTETEGAGEATEVTEDAPGSLPQNG